MNNQNSNTIQSNNTQKVSNTMTKKTAAQQTAAQYATVREALASLSPEIENSYQSGVDWHDAPNRISLPVTKTKAEAARQLAQEAAADEETEDRILRFPYRPFDVAVNAHRVLAQTMGGIGAGITQQSFFGEVRPTTVKVSVDVDETIDVPWGLFSFLPLEAQIEFGAMNDPELGAVGCIKITAPRKYKASIDGMEVMIREQLREHSIYKGKAFRGTDDPKFISAEGNKTVVYNDDTYAMLRASVLGVIENADLFRQDKRRVSKRVLLHGEYGTGKSEFGMLAAETSVNNGWTFLVFDSKKGSLDDLEQTIRMAEMYSPAVVLIEDVDVFAEQQDAQTISRLSNLFDGVTNKRSEVLLLMTSNHPGKFNPAMTRAGRIDAMIEVGRLNRKALEKMIRRVIGDHRLDSDVNFDTIADAMEQMPPAFVRRCFDSAAEAAIIRTGSLDYVLATEDFVAAAHLMQPHYEYHREMTEKPVDAPTVDRLLGALVKDTVDERLVAHRVDLENGSLVEVD